LICRTTLEERRRVLLLLPVSHTQVPNTNLKEAIDNWRLYGNLSVAFR
jgi:hypothetical protein